MSEYTEKVTLYSGQRFVNCSCSEAEKREYSILHNTRPMPLPQKLIEAIEMLLWYSPNNPASKQRFENEYLNNMIFENAVMTYFLRFLRMNPEDVCFVEGDSLNMSLVEPYLNKACCKCHKMIVAKDHDETKLTCILRHVRNCLAHGNFNLINGEDFIGFDTGHKKYTGVFKTTLTELHEFCVQLIKYPDFTISHIFQYVLLKKGYSVVPYITGKFNYREEGSEELIFAIKEDMAVRINCSRYIDKVGVEHVKTINEFVVEFDKQFNADIAYIDLYFCEKEKCLVKKVGAAKFIISKKGLETLFVDGTITLDDCLKL